MFKQLGRYGIAGIILALIGLAVVAIESPIVAAGLLLILLGTALLLRGLIGYGLEAVGMGGML
ncbi:DUF7470 family protein [Halocatena halophila]|uniref:DUF7470 family protein n=1 Tax=Halocatena halophila TaxID=2814576 RepID=UPI002ED295ED